MRKLVMIVLAGLLSLGACGDEDPDRPTATSWTPRWEAVRDLVPTAEQIDDDDGTQLCGEFLGDVRERREDLSPTPDPALDQLVQTWVSEAEALGLDCEREGDLEERLATLEGLADDIDAAILRLEP